MREQPRPPLIGFFLSISIAPRIMSSPRESGKKHVRLLELLEEIYFYQNVSIYNEVP